MSAAPVADRLLFFVSCLLFIAAGVGIGNGDPAWHAFVLGFLGGAADGVRCVVRAL